MSAENRARLKVIEGGGEGPPRTVHGVPLPPAPRRGLRFSVWHGPHHWTNWSIQKANTRSFVACADGKATRHPNARWRAWLWERAAEGEVVVGSWGEAPRAAAPRLEEIE